MDDAVLLGRPALAGLGGGEERTFGRRARFAPKAERVIAWLHVRDWERECRHAGMIETEWPERDDSGVVRWAGGSLHALDRASAIGTR